MLFEKNIGQGIFCPPPCFPKFCLKERFVGTGKDESQGGQGLGNKKGFGTTWKPNELSLALVTFVMWFERCREGGTVGNAISSFQKVRAPSP